MTTTTDASTFAPVEVPAKYAKAIIAIITAVLTVLTTALLDSRLDSTDLVNVGIAFLTAFGVYALPNFSQSTGAYIKVLVAFAGTALQALLPFLINGEVTTQQWLLVLLAAIGALGVGVVPNANPELIAAQAALLPSNVVVVGNEQVPTGTTINVSGASFPEADKPTEPVEDTPPDA